jgi:hypothetical protein
MKKIQLKVLSKKMFFFVFGRLLEANYEIPYVCKYLKIKNNYKYICMYMTGRYHWLNKLL